MPLSEGRYKQWANRLALYQNVVAKLRRTPQVEAAAVSGTGTPPYNGFRSKAILDDRPASQAPEIRVNLVQDGYFAAVGTRLLRGRDLTEADVLQGRPVAVITDDMVKRDFVGGKDPLGHHIQVDIFSQPLPPQLLKSPQFRNSFEIVGVAASARNRGLNEPPVPAMFIPYSMILPPSVFVIARSKGDPDALIAPAREAVRAVDKSQPITLTRTLEGWLSTATAYQSFATFLFGVFGAIGLSLAAAGVFSVVSYSVAHRTREFGIRMALGAEPRDVLILVLLATGRVLVIGLFVGLGLSILASRSLADHMEGMGKADPFLFVARSRHPHSGHGNCLFASGSIRHTNTAGRGAPPRLTLPRTLQTVDLCCSCRLGVFACAFMKGSRALMQIQLNSDKNVTVDTEMSKLVEQEISHAIGRFETHITRVEVHLSDVNSHKAGLRESAAWSKPDPRAASPSVPAMKQRPSSRLFVEPQLR